MHSSYQTDPQKRFLSGARLLFSGKSVIPFAWAVVPWEHCNNHEWLHVWANWIAPIRQTPPAAMWGHEGSRKKYLVTKSLLSLNRSKEGIPESFNPSSLNTFFTHCWPMRNHLAVSIKIINVLWLRTSEIILQINMAHMRSGMCARSSAVVLFVAAADRRHKCPSAGAHRTSYRFWVHWCIRSLQLWKRKRTLWTEGKRP